MFKVFIFSIFTFILSGCTQTYAPLPTVNKVDINRYLGTWYEMARYEHYFEKGCSNVSATYTLNESGKINVLNRCTKGGEEDIAEGIAYAIDETFSKLKVSFFRPFYGNYHILLLDSEYSYVVIGEPSREYFWILSRKNVLDEKIKENILKKMPQWGYSSEKLIWTQHDEKG